MFKKIHNNLVESDDGFSVEIIWRGGIKYKEGSKTYHVASDMIVNSAKVDGTEFLGGSYGMLVYKKRIIDMESSGESSELTDDGKICEIIENIRKAFLFLGYTLKIAESY